MVAVPDPDLGGSRFDKKTIRKILVADDEAHIVRLVQVVLERAGYKVVTASDGKEALDKVASGLPDLIVLDVMMPCMDGFEVLRTLRASPETRRIPVIVLSQKVQDVDLFRGWQSGAEAYLTKPFNPAELLFVVARM